MSVFYFLLRAVKFIFPHLCSLCVFYCIDGMHYRRGELVCKKLNKNRHIYTSTCFIEALVTEQTLLEISGLVLAEHSYSSKKEIMHFWQQKEQQVFHTEKHVEHLVL